MGIQSPFVTFALTTLVHFLGLNEKVSAVIDHVSIIICPLKSSLSLILCYNV